jgi:cob(I)alamin adenosyltransferase
MEKVQGLVQIYTGDGKGKTTAALGLALRAAGHGMRVLIIQFMKTVRYYGELEAVKRLAPNVEIVQKGKPCPTSDAEYVESKGCFVDPRNPAPEDIAAARDGLTFSAEVLRKAEHDIVILDEVLCAIQFRLITCEDVVKLVRMKPPDMELILTGRGAPAELIQLADLVTEMRQVKHPFDRGITARKGVEY